MIKTHKHSNTKRSKKIIRKNNKKTRKVMKGGSIFSNIKKAAMQKYNKDYYKTKARRMYGYRSPYDPNSSAGKQFMAATKRYEDELLSSYTRPRQEQKAINNWFKKTR
jgi:hypothetical protein